MPSFIPFIFVGYIINATLSSLCFKKNKVSALDTLLTIAVFGFVINGLVFAFGFIWLDLTNYVTWITFLWSLLRGVLIVAGLFFVVKAFQRLPVTLISPVTMVSIVPLLFLSWLIFDDEVSTIIIILVLTMLVACIGLVFVEHKNQANAKAVPSSSLGSKIVTAKTETQEQGNKENYENDKETEVQKRKKSTFLIGLSFLALAMTCFLATQIITRILGETGQHMITITFLNSLVIFVVVLLIFLIVQKNPIKIFAANVKNPLQIGIGITDTIWLFFYVPLVMAMNLGVQSAIARISVALTVLCGVFILKEKVSKWAYPIIAIIIGLGIAIGLLMNY